MTIRLLISVCCTAMCVVFSGCKKDSTNGSDNPCLLLQNMRPAQFTPVTKGGTIQLSTGYLDGVTYNWSGPGNFQSTLQKPTVTTNADYFHRGWYYVNARIDGCSPHLDSVYVDVKFPQGTPSCTLVNNFASFSGPLLLGDQSYNYVNFSQGSTGYEVNANSSNGDMTISMSTYWNTHPLEEGIYYTTSDPLPDYIDQVHLGNVNSSIYWQGEAGKPVYVSRVNGKARVSFCGIKFSGSLGGPSYNTTVSAQITEP